jgi:hypothetical protein
MVVVVLLLLGLLLLTRRCNSTVVLAAAADRLLVHCVLLCRFLLAVSDLLKAELKALGDRVPPSWTIDLPTHSGVTVSNTWTLHTATACAANRR